MWNESPTGYLLCPGTGKGRAHTHKAAFIHLSLTMVHGADLSHTSSNYAATLAIHHRCAEGLCPREVGRGWGDVPGP